VNVSTYVVKHFQLFHPFLVRLVQSESDFITFQFHPLVVSLSDIVQERVFMS